MNLSHSILDITSFKDKGQQLHDAIVRETKRVDQLGNKGFSLEQYDVLLMTQQQYDDLNKLSGHIQDYFHSDDKVYVTPYNAMEVRVDKRKRLTFEETMQLDDKSFVEWEKENI